MNFFLTYITTKNEEEALKLANLAVQKNLAACGNIFPKMKEARNPSIVCAVSTIAATALAIQLRITRLLLYRYFKKS